MFNRLPSEKRDLVARLPFKVFAAVAGEPTPEKLRSLRSALEVPVWAASEFGRALAAHAAASYEIHYRMYAARDLIDCPVRMREALDHVRTHISPAATDELRTDLICFAEAIASGNATVVERIFGENEYTSRLTRRGELSRCEPTPIPTPAARHDDSGAFFDLRINDPARVKWWTKGEAEATVVRIIDETSDAKTFVFRISPETLFSYKPGQFITLDITINGENVKRSYSLSSSPTRPQTLEITVKRAPSQRPDVTPGLVSNWLHDHVKVGDKIRFKGPNGRFTCADDTNKKMLLISAGSGIVPVMGMARFLCDSHADRDIIFYHSARTMDDFIYRRELERMASYYANFRLVLTVTRPDPFDAYYGFTGRIALAQLEIGFPDYQERAVYLCGPNPFMESVKEILQDAGFQMKNFYWESFGGSKTPKPTKSTQVELVSRAAAGIPITAEKTVCKAEDAMIVFLRSGKEIKCSSADYILDIADKNEIEIDFSCRSGSCGECKVVKTEGDVVMDADDGLMEEDRSAGRILTCVGRPRGRVVLDA